MPEGLNSEWSTGLAEDYHIKISTGELGNKLDTPRRKVFHSETCTWVDILNSGGCSSIKVYCAMSNSQQIGTGRYYVGQPPWSRRKKRQLKTRARLCLKDQMQNIMKSGKTSSDVSWIRPRACGSFPLQSWSAVQSLKKTQLRTSNFMLWKINWMRPSDNKATEQSLLSLGSADRQMCSLHKNRFWVVKLAKEKLTFKIGKC